VKAANAAAASWALELKRSTKAETSDSQALSSAAVRTGAGGREDALVPVLDVVPVGPELPAQPATSASDAAAHASALAVRPVTTVTSAIRVTLGDDVRQPGPQRVRADPNLNVWNFLAAPPGIAAWIGAVVAWPHRRG
jgi:hypothetical protein